MILSLKKREIEVILDSISESSGTLENKSSTFILEYKKTINDILNKISQIPAIEQDIRDYAIELKWDDI